MVLALLLALTASAHAQSGGYDLSWNTFDGGGATWSTGGGYTLGGSIGQAVAGLMSGGAYQLAGGFWGGVRAVFDRYVPLVLG